jgi:type I restriction-modification system DNA methylase subunit
MEGQKDKTGKINGYTDLPWNALNEVTKRFQSFKIENGGKYSRDNHLNPMKDTDLLDAIFRHLIAYINGEDLDEKGGSHFTAIALNALMLEELRLNGSLIDNRLITIRESNWYIAEISKEMARKLYQHTSIFGIDAAGVESLIDEEADFDRFDRFVIERDD